MPCSNNKAMPCRLAAAEEGVQHTTLLSETILYDAPPADFQCDGAVIGACPTGVTPEKDPRVFPNLKCVHIERGSNSAEGTRESFPLLCFTVGGVWIPDAAGAAAPPIRPLAYLV